MKKNKIFYGLVICLLVLLCGTVSYAKILVISPHPDDDILTSSGIIYNAVKRGEPVKVVYMTNGDFTGIATGFTREAEGVTAEAYLGMAESDLIFFGYPDGYLDTLYSTCTLSTDICVPSSVTNQSVTYANRGLGSTDYHNYIFGHHADYNKYNMVLDLQGIISSFKPDHILTYGENDLHPDHRTSYAVLRDALINVRISDPTYNPTIHKTNLQINASDPWPNPYDPSVYFAEIPNLFSITGLLWEDRESLDVPLVMQTATYMKNKKFLALFSHKTQRANINIYLLYIHKDEFFWTEPAVAGNNPPVPNAGLDQTVSEGASVHLDGSGSIDPDSDPLSYQWVQTGGLSVVLSNPIVMSPTFTAPTGLAQDQTLTFSLVVSDGTFTSVPDSVSVIVTAASPDPNSIEQNIAPLAVVTASSEASADQAAIKAVDGFINGDLGYPDVGIPGEGDYTKEWSTFGEKANAWLQLDWTATYTVNRVILYDRPNPDDQILSATLIFSDGTTTQIGPLDNNGGGVEIALSSKQTSSIRMRVDTVSGSTLNIGLAEMEVYGWQTGKENTITTIGSASNPSNYGSSVTFTATVTGGIVTTPTGTVTFKEGATVLGAAALTGSGSSASAVLNISTFTAGAHDIRAVYNGNATFAASASSPLTQTVNKIAPTASVVSSALTSTYGVSVTFTATVSSGTTTPTGSVSFMDGATTLGSGALNGSGIATYVTSSLSVAGSPHSITVEYSGDTNFSPLTSSAIFQIVNKASQTIAVGTHAPSTAVYNSQFTVAATVSSGLSVTYSSGSTGICTNVGATFTMVSGTGTCVVQFDQAGDANYTAATRVTENTTAVKADQTITFGALAIKAVGDANYAPGATASSTLAVTYASSNLSVATIVGGNIHIVSAGTTTITASQAGDANYNAATPVEQGLIVASTAQSITVTTHAPVSALYNSTFNVAATASSGLSVAITTSGGCSGSGSGSATITMTSGTTTCTVNYNQAGSADFGAAPQVSETTTAQMIDQATLTVIVTPSTVAYGSTAALSTSGGSGTGAVTYSVGASTGCSVAGSTLSVTSASGTCSVTATKAADANYNAATSIAVSVALTVSPNGDLNGDNIVDILDALKALRIAAGLDTPTASDIAHGDVAPLVIGIRTPDGKIDLSDVVAILRKSVGLSSW